MCFGILAQSGHAIDRPVQPPETNLPDQLREWARDRRVLTAKLARRLLCPTSVDLKMSAQPVRLRTVARHGHHSEKGCSE